MNIFINNFSVESSLEEIIFYLMLTSTFFFPIDKYLCWSNIQGNITRSLKRKKEKKISTQLERIASKLIPLR